MYFTHITILYRVYACWLPRIYRSYVWLPLSSFEVNYIIHYKNLCMPCLYSGSNIRGDVVETKAPARRWSIPFWNKDHFSRTFGKFYMNNLLFSVLFGPPSNCHHKTFGYKSGPALVIL